MFQHGGLLSTQDKEGLSVLDLTMKDRPSHVVFRNAGELGWSVCGGYFQCCGL